MDGALLSHPGVAEAVSFSAPDEKYGEVVAAAVVLALVEDLVTIFKWELILILQRQHLAVRKRFLSQKM